MHGGDPRPPRLTPAVAVRARVRQLLRLLMCGCARIIRVRASHRSIDHSKDIIACSIIMAIAHSPNKVRPC